MEAGLFLRDKLLSLAARAHRLARIDHASVGIRPQDLPYAPSPAHFRAANQRLHSIDRQIARRLAMLSKTWSTVPTDRVLFDMALVEREIDRARRAWGLFFDVLIQRGTTFAPVLAGARRNRSGLLRRHSPSGTWDVQGALAEPVDLHGHGYSPATLRRGVVLTRLLVKQIHSRSSAFHGTGISLAIGVST